jgi:hypothetical protein
MQKWREYIFQLNSMEISFFDAKAAFTFAISFGRKTHETMTVVIVALAPRNQYKDTQHNET